jgi:ribosomal protein S18 acetylase RimI-like enzyme
METGDVLGRSVADASVRPASPADTGAMGAVQSRAWRSAYRDLLPAAILDQLDPPVLAATWRTAVEAPPSRRHAVLVACSGSAVVGFVAVAPATDPDVEARDGDIAALVVDPAHQRAGHGSRLLSAAVATLRDGGSTGVVTWVPLADEPRRAFLQSAGMVPDGARRSYRGDDDREVTEVRLTAALAES